jgi:hypothetical protein
MRRVLMLGLALCCGCRSGQQAWPRSGGCCEQELGVDEVHEAASREANRLLVAQQHVAEGAPQPTVRREGCVWHAFVSFEKVTDTLAEMDLDACTGAIRNSRLSGSP